MKVSWKINMLLGMEFHWIYWLFHLSYPDVNMIGPQEDNSSSLRIIDTAVKSVKIVYIIFYMDILIIGGRNTARLWSLICQQKIW